MGTHRYKTEEITFEGPRLTGSKSRKKQTGLTKLKSNGSSSSYIDRFIPILIL